MLSEEPALSARFSGTGYFTGKLYIVRICTNDLFREDKGTHDRTDRRMDITAGGIRSDRKCSSDCTILCGCIEYIENNNQDGGKQRCRYSVWKKAVNLR